MKQLVFASAWLLSMRILAKVLVPVAALGWYFSGLKASQVLSLLVISAVAHLILNSVEGSKS